MEQKDEAEKRFVVDNMLGKVAKWLRVLGFDTRYERFVQQKQVDEYRDKGFLLVTRNQRWCGQRQVFCLSANDPKEQLRELVYLVPISSQEVRLLHRCILCNQLLYKLPREQALGAVPDYVFDTNSSFYCCPHCRKVYWPGSHPLRMKNRLQEVLGWYINC